MDKIRIYIALLFCQAISFILPVLAQNNTGSDCNWYNTLYSYDSMGNITSLSRNGLLDDGNYDYYPYGGLMANSTNHNQQRYKYNGKELDRMHGLDWYDYGARWMDAAIGRWHVMDPLCEKYYDVSPYAYCAGDGKGSLNQKTVGVAHEFAHVVLYLRNLPFGHRQPNVDNFVYGRSTFISKKLGYDY